ncbi:hypothetical protein J2800_001598 [Caulobacter rhizosphaerae]|jgi:hypothetical protein|uniref:Uncharacterized protein n=1 Tax=Caulobacter rhizosphaerae TaxID=2010972 RepID=A0ABU1MXG3_9CAUL|nr:hypothetical protein [Caulobacter rhizosphaerae]MDR6530859.1 hypothetical protein [Caulobacter rhizosphaerae]
MTTITSGRDLVAMSPPPKVRVNWGRIGFIMLNVAAWAGIVAGVRLLG